MSILLETTLGDIVIDLDLEGSPELCKNVLKLAKARYYSQSLVYNVQANRFCQIGDPHGDGTGGACAQGLIACDGSLSKVLKSQHRFLKSSLGRPLTPEECKQKGRVVAAEMKGIPDTIGSQLLITTSEGQDMALDGYSSRIRRTGDNDENQSRQLFRSIGVVVEDEKNVLDQIGSAFCDADGRPYADVRIVRALIVDDPFEDSEGMEVLFKARGVKFQEKKQEDEDERVIGSPEWERPPEEVIEERIPADQVDSLSGEQSMEKLREREEEYLKKQDKSRAVVLEMLGDLPSADITAPENVLFVCKLNPVTEDEDLELIFSRFDERVKAEIIRDPDTGNSLQYAFIEFSKKEQAVEAYFKMNNALVDDRRIKVDFSQSVSKVWDKYNQRMRTSTGGRSNSAMPRDPFGGGPPHRNHGSPHSSHGPPRGNGRGFQRNGPPNHDNRRQDNSSRAQYGRPYHDQGGRGRGNQQQRGREPPRRHFQDNHQRPPYRPHGRNEDSRNHGREMGNREHGRDQEHRGLGRHEQQHGEVDQFGREIRRDTRPPPLGKDDSAPDAGSSVDSRPRDLHRQKHRKERRKHHRSKEKKHRKTRSSRDDNYSSEGSSPSRSRGRSRDHESHREHRRSSGERRSHHDEKSSRGERGDDTNDRRGGSKRTDRRERNRSRSHDRDRRRRRSRSRSHSDNDEGRRERSRDGKRKDRDRHRHEDDRSDHDGRKRRRRHDSPDR